MVYTMRIYTDGGCRGNGKRGAIGAAAAVFKAKFGRSIPWVEALPRYPTPTNQRAEITAIIIAIERALERYEELDTRPRLNVTIYSDSRYAVDCMTKLIYKWTRNGWINAHGYPVANQDLLKKASDLDDQLSELGSVEYIWIPREQNSEADRYCNEKMDEEYRWFYLYDSDTDSDSDW
ncbi:ribonuclease H-like domain-containing protein [Aspergillus navahoensis]